MSRDMQKRIELDATPEQVWDAIATGPGISTWFVPTTVEPQVGGTVTQAFGGGASEVSGKVTAFEPSTHFAYGPADVPADAPNYAFEFFVEGRDGGGTVLRFVHSGFLDGPDWDAEYDSFDKGWDLFLFNLRAYFSHFAGRPVTNVVAMSFVEGSREAAWPVLLHGLGLASMPAIGDEVTFTPEGLDAVTGTVDVATPEFLGIRTERGLYRIGAEGEQGCGVSAYHYLYDADTEGTALTETWQTWLTSLFPLTVTTPA